MSASSRSFTLEDFMLRFDDPTDEKAPAARKPVTTRSAWENIKRVAKSAMGVGSRGD